MFHEVIDSPGRLLVVQVPKAYSTDAYILKGLSRSDRSGTTDQGLQPSREATIVILISVGVRLLTIHVRRMFCLALFTLHLVIILLRS